MFNLKKYREEISEKIKKAEETLEHYKYSSDSQSVHMTTLLKEEISTLKWTIKLTYELESPTGQ